MPFMLHYCNITSAGSTILTKEWVGNTDRIILLIMTSEQVWFKDYLYFACDGHLTLSLAMLEMHFGLAYNKLIYQVVLYQTYSRSNLNIPFHENYFFHIYSSKRVEIETKNWHNFSNNNKIWPHLQFSKSGKNCFDFSTVLCK